MSADPRAHDQRRRDAEHRPNTRDVSMIEGEVEVLEIDELPHERGDRFVAHTRFPTAS